MLNGSTLIQFEACDLRINGETYTNFEANISGRPYHPTTGLQVHEINTIDIPLSEFLKNLTLKHRTKLKAIHLVNNSLSWKIHFFGSFGTITIIGIGAAITFLFCSRRQANINVKFAPDKEKQIELVGLKSSTFEEKIHLKTIADEISTERQKEIETFINTPTPF